MTAEANTIPSLEKSCSLYAVVIKEAMLPVTQLDVREGTDAGKGNGRSVVQRSVGERGRKAGVRWGSQARRLWSRIRDRS